MGECTIDVYLNEIAYWKNIPLRVWEYTIGGYDQEMAQLPRA